MTITKISSNAITQELRDLIDAGGGGAGSLRVYDDGVFKVTGSAISFDSNLSVATTGTVAFISSTDGGGFTQGAKGYNSGNFIVTGSVEIKVILDSEVWDTDGIHSGSSTQFVCNTAGIYFISGQVIWPGNASGIRNIFVRVNNNIDITKFQMNNLGAGTIVPMLISTAYKFNAGDYAELMVFHNSTTNPLTLVSGSTYACAEFLMQRIG